MSQSLVPVANYNRPQLLLGKLAKKYQGYVTKIRSASIKEKKLFSLIKKYNMKIGSMSANNPNIYILISQRNAIYDQIKVLHQNIARMLAN